MQSSRFCISLYLFLFACISINHAFSDDSYSYTKHCSAVLPGYNVTSLSNGESSLPFLSTPYFTGGGSLLRIQPGRSTYYVEKNLKLRLRPDYYLTTAVGVYKIEGFLNIQAPFNDDDFHANYSDGGHNPRRNRASGLVKFPMNGFWSEKSRKLCMVGSASWRGIHRDAVLKLKFDDAENPTIYTSVVSGSLESTASADSPPYFAPILILSFVEVSNYKYSLVVEQVGGAFPSRKNESLSLDATEFCSLMRQGLRCVLLEYAAECTGHCSPFAVGDGDGFLPRSLSVTSIECLEGSKKAKFMATFRNDSSNFYDSFSVGSTVIGEASWDGRRNRVIGVACEILNPSHHQLGNVVQNCTMRLIIRYPSVLTIRNDAKIVGQIWSSKGVEDSGYFTQINLSVGDGNGQPSFSEQRYEYTQMDRVRKCCTKIKTADKKGDVYPDGQSYDMRFDMNIKNGKGQKLAWACATPVWVQNESYQGGEGGGGGFAVAQSAAALQPQKYATTSSPTKMSYKIRIGQNYKQELQILSNITSPSLNLPGSYSGEVEITAEGLYDSATGHLCMVGCRRVVQNSTNVFKDCEVLVEFDFPPLNRDRGGLTTGVLRSTRLKTDPLHFDDLILQSNAYYRKEAERSLWRMDMELAMVLISNTLACIFVALQIFHVKRSPEVPLCVSLVMLVVLSVGYMIPLVLNSEAVFWGYHEKSMLHLGGGGMLEANEVAVRVMTMVALLLELRLLQLVWAAKQSSKNGEKKAGLVSLLFYMLVALLVVLIKWRRKTNVSVWGDLGRCAGLILDGFLAPQILLNVLRSSTEKALSVPFYVGTSMIRLVPHAYNQYRAHSYPKVDLNATYYYANPTADMYSTAWDILIPCGIMALAVIVFVQQHHGGRCILPKRSMYQKLPTADN